MVFNGPCVQSLTVAHVVVARVVVARVVVAHVVVAHVVVAHVVVAHVVVAHVVVAHVVCAEEGKFFVKWEFDPQPDLGRPWVNLGGCRCYRSMLHSLYGHLSITHSAIPIPTH